jgi:hypothetical protein
VNAKTTKSSPAKGRDGRLRSVNADDESLAGIRAKAAANSLRVTQHAQQEMVEDAFLLDDVLHALTNATMIEDYPDHRRGACCLVSGSAPEQADSHRVYHHECGAYHHYGV